MKSVAKFGYKVWFMRQLFILSVGVILLLFCGCQSPSKNSFKAPFEVDRAKSDAFPVFLVGRWKANEYGWEFKFERDGSISKLRHLIAEDVNVPEKGTFLEGPDPGTYAVFAMGPCEAQYAGWGRRLKVKIILDYYQMKLPTGDLEGKSYDYFDGAISRDGKTWKVKWRSYGWLEGADPPDIDYINKHPGTLVFTKME